MGQRVRQFCEKGFIDMPDFHLRLVLLLWPIQFDLRSPRYLRPFFVYGVRREYRTYQK